ncbi:hypothetical protein ATANTOWER_023245 [Ataeniobius toweri]|uniref:Uncharacterized protein n=1 Tax=Ataeniobius toweri TaxID=208326 RepID=A0ABU7AGN2_9TELE|nr:hypothetical protein [Ataeniobius toweri]
MGVGCVQIQGLYPSKAAFQDDYVKGCPNSKASPKAADKCTLFSPDFKEEFGASFVVHPIPWLASPAVSCTGVRGALYWGRTPVSRPIVFILPLVFTNEWKLNTDIIQSEYI